MKNKCKFVGIMFLCILIVCTLAVMAYEHTAGMKGAAGGASNASGNTKNTDEADDMLTVVTSFYPMYIAALNIVDGVEGVRLENLSEPQTGCLHDFQLTPEDMKLLSTADVFVINGGGIESFMSDVAKAYPKLDVVDIKALSELAHSHRLPLLIDNTVATAYLVTPLTLGADIVINSTSKYINGNSDAISGVITDSGNFKWDAERYPLLQQYKMFGKFAYIAKLRNGLFRNTGACIAPQTAFYNMLGMETLGLRMERCSHNALALAQFLESQEGVKVNYPGLESSPWHDIADEQLHGGYGAIITIRVGSKEKAFAVMNKLTIPQIVSNIGDTKTLIVHPESTLNAHSTEQEKLDANVYDDMIRISVGIEDVEDLIEDFQNALAD
mgnify:CR=1 FL=1